MAPRKVHSKDFAALEDHAMHRRLTEIRIGEIAVFKSTVIEGRAHKGLLRKILPLEGF